jgi:hypothetical protein
MSLLLIGGSNPLTTAWGQQSTVDLADEKVSDNERLRETLDWLDKYMVDSDLASPGSIEKVRATVAQLTPSQLEQWLIQTRRLRQYIESPEWQETRKWLRGYLKVQAVYSKEEIQAFRQRLFNADPDELLAMLQQIQAKHESMVWMHQASTQARSMDLKARNQRVARQDSINANAAQVAAQRSAPLFGNAMNAGGAGRKQDSGYRVPGPLIDSRSVASWAAFAGAW